ncbi:hypothetical protein llg_34760 [Luteolibacter sp. LG18]|nr:hypothetical protein llg_34760 [Luteolibacter sp. LG18]
MNWRNAKWWQVLPILFLCSVAVLIDPLLNRDCGCSWDLKEQGLTIIIFSLPLLVMVARRLAIRVAVEIRGDECRISEGWISPRTVEFTRGEVVVRHVSTIRPGSPTSEYLEVHVDGKIRKFGKLLCSNKLDFLEALLRPETGVVVAQTAHA